MSLCGIGLSPDNGLSHVKANFSLCILCNFPTISLSRSQQGYEASSHHGSAIEDLETIEGFPTLELLMRKTEKITKKIQELLLSAQERNISRFGLGILHGHGILYTFGEFLDSPKLRMSFVNDKLYLLQMTKFVFDMLEDIVGKGENACVTGSNPVQTLYFCHAFIHLFLCYRVCKMGAHPGLAKQPLIPFNVKKMDFYLGFPSSINDEFKRGCVCVTEDHSFKHGCSPI